MVARGARITASLKLWLMPPREPVARLLSPLTVLDTMPGSGLFRVARTWIDWRYFADILPGIIRRCFPGRLVSKENTNAAGFQSAPVV